MRAVDLFDVNRGVKFSTYAIPWIRQKIGRNVIYTKQDIRLPVYIYELQRIYKKLKHKHPGWDDVLLAKITKKRYDKNRKSNVNPLTVNNAIHFLNDNVFVHIDNSGKNEDGESGLTDTIAAEPTELPSFVDYDKIFEALTYREKFILIERANEVTLADIATELGVSRERVRQVETIALRKARASAKKTYYLATRGKNESNSTKKGCRGSNQKDLQLRQKY